MLPLRIKGARRSLVTRILPLSSMAVLGPWSQTLRGMSIWMSACTKGSERSLQVGTAAGPLPGAQGFGTRTVDASNSEFPGLDDFRSTPRNLLQAQARLWHRDTPGNRHLLQRATRRDIR